MSNAEVQTQSIFMIDRRAGGSENPIVQPLGLMLMALGVMAVLFHRLKQSNIVACIIIGMVVGGTKLDGAISRELGDAFIELGIILVLFMGGLEVDVEAFIARWRLVITNGMGMILINLGFFCALGVATGTTSGAVDTIYFGLGSTLSSTILVLGALKERQEAETLHGQIILGLMVLQDVVAVVSLAILDSLDPKKKGGNVGADIGIMFGKFIATLLILFLLSKYVLKKVFKAFAVSGEMLFIGTVGYAFGVASSCSWVGFSAEIGGFFAGVSIASLPYRLEIEHKVEPIKAFGVVLFFFMLGIDLHLTPESLAKAAPMAVTIGLLTVFILPSIMWGLGYATGLKSRTAFMMGIIINQISEFSLILAQLAHKYEVFTSTQYQIITFGMLFTLLFSSFGHVVADQIYEKMRFLLACLDRRATVPDMEEDGFVFDNHIVLLSFNETGLEIAEYYRSLGQEVCVIQLDPALHSTLKKGYVPMTKRPIDPAMSPRTMEAASGVSRPVGKPVVMENGHGNGHSRVGMPYQGMGRVNGMQQMNGLAPRVSGSMNHMTPVYGSPNGMNGLYGSSNASSLYGSGRQVGGGSLYGSGRQPGPMPGTSLYGNGLQPTPFIMGTGFGNELGDAEQEIVDEEMIVGCAFGHEGADPITYHVPLQTGNGPQFSAPSPMAPHVGQVSGSLFIPGSPDSVPQKGKGEAKVPSIANFTRLPTARAKAGRESVEKSISYIANFSSTPTFSRLPTARATAGHDSMQTSFKNIGESVHGLEDAVEGAGVGSNIYSLYADPESPESWEHYGLHKAKIVISCMVAGQEAEVRLSGELKKAGVPFLAITNSNTEANELYEAGCRYVIQQEYLAAKVMHQLFKEEAKKSCENMFVNQQRDHMRELEKESCDERLAAIQHFL